MDAARRALQRADELAAFTEHPGAITRPLASPALDAAMERVREWMEDAGLETRRDGLGNLAGRRGNGGLVLGSHLDSVANAGRYDGILGVLVGLEVAAATGDLPLEVVAFADEEGMRFESNFLGSRAYLGQLTDRDLALHDSGGTALRDVIGDVSGPPLAPADIAAYLEVHIEQGPVLEAAGLPLGVVTAIAGQSRFRVIFDGHARHSGTTPMDLRNDALAAAAEFVLATERTARAEPGLVATVGELEIPHAAFNVVPGRVEATLDVRHQDDDVREAAALALREATEALCARRGIALTWNPTAANRSTPCTPALVAALAEAVAQTGTAVHELPSGAGHDAATLAGVTDVAMLFIRCAGGISHHPDESVEVEDVALAIEAATRFVRTFVEAHV